MIRHFWSTAKMLSSSRFRAGLKRACPAAVWAADSIQKAKITSFMGSREKNIAPLQAAKNKPGPLQQRRAGF
jgi:hypothetical protein